MLTPRYAVCQNPKSGALSLSRMPRGMSEKDFAKSRKLRLLFKSQSYEECQRFVDGLDVVRSVLES